MFSIRPDTVHSLLPRLTRNSLEPDPEILVVDPPGSTKMLIKRRATERNVLNNEGGFPLLLIFSPLISTLVSSPVRISSFSKAFLYTLRIRLAMS